MTTIPMYVQKNTAILV